MADKVLLVEDDTDIREIITLILSNENFEILQSSADKLESDMATFKPDLVILDYLLNHKLSGADLCRIIKAGKETEHLPVILVSAIPELEHISKRCGATAYITKPFDIVEFIKTATDSLKAVNNAETL